MSLTLWERILEATVEHAAIIEARAPKTQRNVQHRNLIVFHGGEPLALPTSYWKQILEVFARVTRHAKEPYSLSVQSNLFSLQQEKIDLLREHGAQISVSFDLVPGVRLNVAGQPTEETVSRNIDTLRAQGVKLGAIAVLAKHTVDHVTRIHDFFAEREMGMRFCRCSTGPPRGTSARSGRTTPAFGVG
jgi:sulfatase maturation enzyme AslB (radical SAM superfamily)